MILKAPLITVGVPMVDASGCVTPEALGFFMALWNRTNGAAGPAAPFTGTDTINVAAAQAAASAASSAASAASASASAASAAVADVQALAALADVETPHSDDQAALLAQLIAD